MINEQAGADPDCLLKCLDPAKMKAGEERDESTRQCVQRKSLGRKVQQRD